MIFKRVLSLIGNENNRDNDLVNIPQEISDALDAYQTKRDIAKIHAEEIEKNRKEKLELELAREKLRRRFDVDSEDNQGGPDLTTIKLDIINIMIVMIIMIILKPTILNSIFINYFFLNHF